MLVSLLQLATLYLLITLYLKVFKRQKSTIFCIAFSVLNFIVIQNPYISPYGDKYSMAFIISFIAGLFFDIKELVIFILITAIGLIVENKVIISSYVIPDLLTHIFSLGLGYYIGKTLYKKNKINPFSSILYVAIISSIYSIIYLIYLSLNIKANSIIKFDLAYYMYTITVMVVLFIALVIIYIFGDKNVEEKNTLLHIFIRKFRILLIITFFITVFLNNRLFNLYITHISYDMINANCDLALKTIDEVEKEYGEGSLYYDKNAINLVSGWYSQTNGTIYFMDKDFNFISNSMDFMKTGITDEDISPAGFKDILNHKENEIFEFNNNGIDVYVKYVKKSDYYVISFLSTTEIVNSISVISYLTSYAIIVTMLAIFLLVYHIMRKNIATRIQETNRKLTEISKGDYDVVFEDKSSKEFVELSKHINDTVKALKNTIREVKEKNKQELELAKKIQESQLRTDEIEHIAFDISAINIPAEEVGGDFYDYFYIDYRHVMFLIADVSGKGIPGAMFMIKAKNAIINFAKLKLPLEEIVRRTNISLCQNNDAMMFVTSFMAILDLKTGLLKYVNCGHNVPIISTKNADGYDVSYLNTMQQTILGIDSEVVYKAEDITLKEGDKITLYTDGITEARNRQKAFYGEEKLKEVYKDINDLSPNEINAKIVDSVKVFSDDAGQFDDITLLTLLYKNTKNTIRLDATDKDINTGKEFLNKFIKLYDMPIDVERNLKVVYDEIYSNIENYAYKNNGGELIFNVNLCGKDTIEMVFMDKGDEFNPIDYKSEKTERNIEEKFDGGMGLMFCKNIMDEIKYERKDGYNILSLYKKFN